GIAADGGDAVDRQRHLDALVVLWIRWVAGNTTAVGIGELEVDPTRHITVGRGAADVKAAQLLLATGKEAIVGRSHLAAKALDISQLRAQGQHVAPFLVKLE